MHASASEAVVFPSQCVIDTPHMLAAIQGPAGDDVMPTKLIEPVRGGRCLAPLCIFPEGRPADSMMICGLIDTGANNSAIDYRLATVLGLPIVGSRVVSAHNGVMTQPTYRAVIDFWLQGHGPAARVITAELHAMPQPMIGGTMLIGMDLLKIGEFGLHASGIWDFSF